jgi:hypothetical protein
MNIKGNVLKVSSSDTCPYNAQVTSMRFIPVNASSYARIYAGPTAASTLIYEASGASELFEKVKLHLKKDYLVDVSAGNSIETTEETGVRSSFKVEASAFASTDQADFFVWTQWDGETVAVWIDKDDDGTEPTAAEYLAADQKFKAITETGYTAFNIQNAIADCVMVDCDMALENGQPLTIAQTHTGPCATPVAYKADGSPGSSLTISAVVPGVDSDHFAKWFSVVQDATTYNFWFKVGGFGQDPTSGGTAIQVNLSTGDSAEDVATAIQAAADANNVTATQDGNVVTFDDATSVTNQTTGDTFPGCSIYLYLK